MKRRAIRQSPAASFFVLARPIYASCARSFLVVWSLASLWKSARAQLTKNRHG
jgi:hypothetical protein